MHEKARDVADLFARGRIGRRDLFRRMGQPGVSIAAASYFVNEAQTRAMAADFDWKANKGKTLTLLNNKHPYADAMIVDLDTFQNMTGMDVKYDGCPEDVYFDKVTAEIHTQSTAYRGF